MNNYAWDNGVFIRSMGSNGDLGGLAKDRKSWEMFYLLVEKIILYTKQWEWVKANTI